MKPYLHAVSAAKKWGGRPEDYLLVEDFLDSSKAYHADMRHRALYHHSAGIFVVEAVLGHNLTNTDGVLVSTRDVAELHVLEDMGRIPSPSDYLAGLPFYDWLGGPARAKNTQATGEPIPRIMAADYPQHERQQDGRRLLTDLAARFRAQLDAD